MMVFMVHVSTYDIHRFRFNCLELVFMYIVTGNLATFFSEVRLLVIIHRASSSLPVISDSSARARSVLPPDRLHIIGIEVQLFLYDGIGFRRTSVGIFLSLCQRLKEPGCQFRMLCYPLIGGNHLRIQRLAALCETRQRR